MNSWSKSNSLKGYINTHPVETGSETISLYIPLYEQGSPEAWLKFQNILKGQSLNKDPQLYAIAKNLLSR